MKKSMLFIMMLFFSGVVQASAIPVVAITNPDNKSTFTAGSNIVIIATALATEGTISSVSFYNGSILLGQTSKSPYTYIWDDVSAGTYALTAVATDTNKVSTTSAAVTITVTPVPEVAIVSPAHDSTFTAGSNISLIATASEAKGTIATVSFYNGSTLLTTSSMTPLSCRYTWTNVPAGTYTLTAVATDTNKVATTSSPITVTVMPSSASVVAITSPVNNSAYTAGSNITITAAASEQNGIIREVYFFDGGYYLGTSTVSPYSYTWDNVLAGTHSLTVEATDDKGGTLISAPVNITVNPAPVLPKTLVEQPGKQLK